MNYGHLVVMDKPVDETNLDTFTSHKDFMEWRDAIWPAFSEAYPGIADDEGPQNYADLFGQNFANKIFQTGERLLEEEELKKPLSVDGHEYKIIKVIDVLWSGWESDSKAWAVETPTGIRLVMSDHGSRHFADPSKLQARIDEYRAAIAATQEMQALLGVASDK